MVISSVVEVVGSGVVGAGVVGAGVVGAGVVGAGVVGAGVVGAGVVGAGVVGGDVGSGVGHSGSRAGPHCPSTIKQQSKPELGVNARHSFAFVTDGWQSAFARNANKDNRKIAIILSCFF